MSTWRDERVSGRTLPPKNTKPFSSNNSSEHSADCGPLKVLLHPQFGFFRLSYSGKVYFVAITGKLGLVRWTHVNSQVSCDG